MERVVFEPDPVGVPYDTDEVLDLLYMRDERLARRDQQPSDDLPDHLSLIGREIGELRARLAAIAMRKQGVHAYPAQFTGTIDGMEDRRAVTLSLIIRELPLPTIDENWSEIVDFRNEPEAKGLMAGLREWVADVARSDRSSTEIQDKLAYLLYRYRSAVKLYRLRYQVGSISVVVKTTLDAASYALRLQLGKAFDSLFAIHEGKMKLLESELSAPGHELAYIARAGERFGQDGGPPSYGR